MNETMQNLSNMIDEYVEFKTALATAKTAYERDNAEIERLSELVEFCDGIAIYEGVLRKVSEQLREALSRQRESEIAYNELLKKEKGFEGLKNDVVSETAEELESQQMGK